jgi:RNA recognition motif-containing protein
MNTAAMELLEDGYSSSSSPNHSEHSGLPGSDDGVNREEDPEIMRREMQVQANLTVRSEHEGYLQLLRDNKLHLKLLDAFDVYHSQFTMGIELWEEWIQLAAVTIPTNWQRREGIWRACVTEHNTVSLWVQYMEFMAVATLQAGSEDEKVKATWIEQARQVMKEATRKNGLHVVEGHKIWLSYASFEEYLGNRSVVVDILQRAIQIPLLEHGEVLASLQELQLSDDIQEKIQALHTAMEKELKKRMKYEKMVRNMEGKSPPLGAYVEYLQFEGEKGGWDRFLNLHQRALLACGYEIPLLWEMLLNQLSRTPPAQAKDEAEMLAHGERALSWCPQAVSLWEWRLLLAEKYGVSLSSIGQELLPRALGAAFAGAEGYAGVWVAYLAVCRRMLLSEGEINHAQAPLPPTETETETKEKEKEQKDTTESNSAERDPFRQACTEALHWMDSYFPGQALSVELFWFRVECDRHRLGAWSQAMPPVISKLLDRILRTHGQYWSVMSLLIEGVRVLGNVQRCRQLFQRAVAHVTDYPALVHQQWRQFEQQAGNWRSLVEAERKCQILQGKLATSSTSASTSTEHCNTVVQKGKETVETAHKKRKRDESGDSPPDQGKDNTRTYRTKEEKEALTLCVVNIPYSATLEELKTHFEAAGQIRTVRFALKKGVAFVEFEEEDGLVNALRLDGSDFAGRPITLKRATDKRDKVQEPGGSRSGKDGKKDKAKEKEKGKAIELAARVDQTVLTPRIVKRKQVLRVSQVASRKVHTGDEGTTKSEDPSQAAKKKDQSTTKETTASAAQEGMSNDDFRKMLFASKS